jgi:hypothetical protein
LNMTHWPSMPHRGRWAGAYRTPSSCDLLLPAPFSAP